MCVCEVCHVCVCVCTHTYFFPQSQKLKAGSAISQRKKPHQSRRERKFKSAKDKRNMSRHEIYLFVMFIET